MKTSCNRRLTAVLGCVLILLVNRIPVHAENGRPLVLATTFPMHQITRNVAQGRPVTVELMLPAALGCPHDYALTPQDMMKLSKARALVVNGLGMEEFLNSALKKANPSLAVIDSSRGITNLLTYIDADHAGHQGHARVNPHLFVSPRMAAQLAQNIAGGLSRIDPSGALVYQENARAFGARMAVLDQRIRALGKKLVHKQIMTQHGVFDYLARDMGLTIAAVLEAHSGKEPSAAEMLGLVNTIKKKKIRAVFTEPQYPPKIALTLARETGIRVASLDPGATGPLAADLGYFDFLMDKNLKTLESVLGGGQ